MKAPSARRVGLALSLALAVTSARADEPSADARPADANAVAEVIVTGTRLPARGDRENSPVQHIDSGVIARSGVLGVEEVINRLPQVAADQGSTVNFQGVGTATVNLRDLGPERTLVLIDGKRVTPGDPSSGSVAPDLNFIPAPLVERVDVLTGGASAVYGSDAIAGVVNFILKKDYSGIGLDVQASAENHANDNAALRAAISDQGFQLPPKQVLDGLGVETSLIAGINAPNGRGNLTLYGDYRQAAAIRGGARDFSACLLTADNGRLDCFGSTAAPANARFIVLDPASFNLVNDVTLDPTGPGDTLRDFDSARDAYNYAPNEYLRRPDARMSGGFFAHYQLNPRVEAYAQLLTMSDTTTVQLAPSGLFEQPFSIACSNPMLSASEVQAFCTDAGIAASGDALVLIGRRDTEGSNRQSRLTHTDYRVVAGLRGDVGDWSYDISAQYSAVSLDERDSHDISLARAADALDVVVGPSGALVCASGDAGCVPYDIFRVGGVTPAALAYLSQPDTARGGTGEAVISANLSGELGRLGFRSPWASSAAALSVGAEGRREPLFYAPDAELTSGDLAGGGSAPAVSGAFSVGEVYAEARLPLVENRGRFLHELSVEGGWRYSTYSQAGAAQTYKLATDWAPGADLRFRASFNRAVRAPNAVELFTPQTISLGAFQVDPCAGSAPLASLSACERSGVTPAEYGNIVPDPDGYNGLVGGNTHLKPETADTLTVGAVLTPQAAPGFYASVDYYDIEVRGVIGEVQPGQSMEQCVGSGDPFFCNAIHRQPGTGSLWLSPSGYVDGLLQNTSFLGSRGIDVTAHDRVELAKLGSLDVDFTGAYLIAMSTVTAPDQPAYDCAGLYGVGCYGPLPRWRHVLRLTWSPSARVQLSGAWRYASSVAIAASSPSPVLNGPFDPADAKLGASSVFDLSVSWRIAPKVELRAGADNIFDTGPPVVGVDFLSGVAANGNSYPGDYDALGRTLFVGLSAHM